MPAFDVAVIGVGGMGSAACYQLAKAGQRVLGIEQFGIPHSRGSSHGTTRILRLGLHESAHYVPLVLRAVELWDEVSGLTQEALFHRVGSLDVAVPESPIFSGSLASCESCGIDHEVLNAAEITRRHPALHPDADMMAVFQPGSGFVLPEVAICAQVNLALDHGAEIHGHERLVDWERRDGHFVLRTDRGAYEAGQIVFTTGAWIGKMLRVPVEAERNVLGWFSVGLNAATFAPSRLPVWIVDSEAHGHFYGFPVHGVPGFKLGRLRHTPLPGVDPDLPREEVCAADEADLRQFVAKYFPAANGPVLSMITCFFENSPDRAPIIDSIPDVPGAWVVGGFSGHGFKYSSAIGEVVRDLVTRAESAFDLTRFRASRFHP